MRLFLDCLPCLLNQVLDAAYLTIDDEAIHNRIMDDALDLLSKYRNYSCAPELCKEMHDIVKFHSGIQDPYLEIKNRDISTAVKLEPELKALSYNSDDLLLNALKVSAIGNTMDSAIINSSDIAVIYMEEIAKKFALSDIDKFYRDLEKADLILILGDNAGEVVFDKVLAEYLSQRCKIIYAVRGAAIINDATVEDAHKTGITKYAELISSGCETPGVIYESCNIKFQRIFNNADIVISKGQGNFEALSDAERAIYFLLKAKCRRIARICGVHVGDYIFKKL